MTQWHFLQCNTMFSHCHCCTATWQIVPCDKMTTWSHCQDGMVTWSHCATWHLWHLVCSFLVTVTNAPEIQGKSGFTDEGAGGVRRTVNIGNKVPLKIFIKFPMNQFTLWFRISLASRLQMWYIEPTFTEWRNHAGKYTRTTLVDDDSSSNS